jgi:hypothetical protein
MQSTYATGQSDMSMRHSNAIKTVSEGATTAITNAVGVMSTALAGISSQVAEFKRSQEKVNERHERDLENAKSDQAKVNVDASTRLNGAYDRIFTLTMSASGTLIVMLGGSTIWLLGRYVFKIW